MPLKRLISHLDILRFAGFKRILGVELSELEANIVEVEARGNPFKKFTQLFFPLKSISIQFSPTDTAEIKSEKIRIAIVENKISTKLAVTSLQSIGVKTIVTTIPFDVSNVIEWIGDNVEKLIRIPISLDDIIIQYELLERNEEFQKIIVVIAKKNEIHQTESILLNAGIELLSIGYSKRDIVNIVSSNDRHFVALSSVDKIHLYSLNNYSLTDYKELPAADIAEALKLESEKEQRQSLKVYGNESFSFGPNFQFQQLEAPQLHTKYLHAFGLGIKGFLSEISPVNFLSNNHRQKTFDVVGQGLLKRAVLTVGILLFFFLTLETVSAIYVGNKIAEYQERLIAESSKVQELHKLQEEIAYFESEIQKQSSTNRRTTVSRTLLELSEKTDEGIALQSVQSIAQSSKNETVKIKGEAVSNESLSRYLKSLQASTLLSSVELKSSGVTQDEYGALKNKILFDIVVTTRK
ncbi:MAG: PilN domain-containing protein [Bacteroidota bacterium]